MLAECFPHPRNRRAKEKKVMNWMSVFQQHEGAWRLSSTQGCWESSTGSEPLQPRVAESLACCQTAGYPGQSCASSPTLVKTGEALEISVCPGTFPSMNVCSACMPSAASSSNSIKLLSCPWLCSPKLPASVFCSASHPVAGRQKVPSLKTKTVAHLHWASHH